MLVLVFLVNILLYLPVLVNPNLLLARGNDLEQQFWPVFYLTRNNFLKFHQIPLWNNLIFAGTPLLPDPQFSPFYPGNILFLFFPTNLAFFVFFVLHSFLACFSSYTLARKCIKLSKRSSLFFSLLYITTPKLSGYLEAGHYGLFAAHAFIPLAIYAIYNASRKVNIKNSILLGIAFSGLYFTHTIIFIIALPASIVLFLLFIINNKKNNTLNKFIFFGIAFLITFGICSVTLLPQIIWLPTTTRKLLAIHPDVFPKWDNLKEFFSNFFLINYSAIKVIDEEKWITLGIGTFIFAFIGFLYIGRKFKIILLIFLSGSFILLINNLSPLYPTLLFENWYQLIRVTTRFWFIPATSLLFLAAYGFEKINSSLKKPYKILVLGIAGLAILENLYISELRLVKRPFMSDVYIRNDLLNFLKNDQEQFRIFCTTRCVSEKQASLNHLELVEGYNTLTQSNYYKITNPMMGGYWDYYTLAIPPAGIGELRPNPELLGDYNVKYVISPYSLKNSNFKLLGFYDNQFYLYENSLYKSRSNQDIVFYSPNLIKINIINKNSNLILRDIYSEGWHAYINGTKEVKINETQIAEREVIFTKNTKFVTFIYLPNTFKIGLVITSITLILIIRFLLKPKMFQFHI